MSAGNGGRNEGRSLVANFLGVHVHEGLCRQRRIPHVLWHSAGSVQLHAHDGQPRESERPINVVVANAPFESVDIAQRENSNDCLP